MQSVGLTIGKLLGGVAVLGCVAAVPAAASTDLQVMEVFTSRYQNGGDVHYTPKIGEDYRITVKYRVVGDKANLFTIRFEMAGQKMEYFAAERNPGEGSLSAQWKLPLDGEIPFRVYLDPYHTAGEVPQTGILAYMNNVGTGSFTPAAPASTIEYFEPRTLYGSQRLMINFATASGMASRLVGIIGNPDTDSFQKLLTSSCEVRSGLGTETLTPSTADPTNAPVYVWDRSNVPIKPIVMKRDYSVQVKNSRVNAAKLRAVTWAQIDSLVNTSYIHKFQLSESVIESNSAAISGFVSQTLGTNFRGRYTPYDAARKLFQAVVARMHYELPPTSRSAVEALNKGWGDCLSYSMLYVATLRNIGIPARVDCGAWEGEKEWHCWSECFFPGIGWMVSDATNCDGWSPDGEFAYCFGNLFNLNQRVTWSRGNTFNTHDVSVWTLQVPAFHWWGNVPDHQLAYDSSIHPPISVGLDLDLP